MAVELKDIIESAEEIERVRVYKEKSEIMHKIADNFHACVHDLICDPESILEYIEKKDLKAICETAQRDLDCIKNAVEKGIVPSSGTDNDIHVPIIDLGITCVCLHERLMKDVKKAEEKIQQEKQKQEDLTDLEAAKPIFAALKNEMQKWEWGNCFDEWTISQYVQEMLELAKKHNVGLGIDGIEETEEVPTTYATELEALEEVE